MTRRTWVWLSGRKRPPSDYEEVSTGVQWYSDPSSRTETGGWRMDSTVIKADWGAFRDPSSVYYRTYVAAQDSAERQLDSVVATARDAGYLSAIDPAWKTTLTSLIGAMSFAEWGVVMAHQHVQRFALSPTVAGCAQFQVMDKLRNAERNLEWYELVHPTAEPGTLNAVWMNAPEMQPLRRYVEEALVVQDWAEIIIAVNLALLGVLQPFLREIYVRGGRASGDFVASAMGATFANDAARQVAWTDAFVNYCAAEPVNATPLSDWFGNYLPAAVAAMDALVLAFPMDGLAADAATVARGELSDRLDALNLKRTDTVVAVLAGYPNPSKV